MTVPGTLKQRFLFIIGVGAFCYVWYDIGVIYALCVGMGMLLGAMLTCFAVE